MPELESPPQVAPSTPPPTAQTAPTTQPQTTSAPTIQAPPATAPQATSPPPQQPAGTVAETSPTTKPQDASAFPEQPAIESESGDRPIESERGLHIEDWPDGFYYILVKADAEKVAEAIAVKENGKAAPTKIGDPADPEKVRVIVGQFKGHPWSHFGWFADEPENFLAELTRQLNTDAIMVSYSDFSGWQFVDVYRNGESIEAFHWGLDYSDELGATDLAEWDTHTKVTTNLEGEDFTDQLLFRSKLRKVSEAEIGQGESFADWLLREHDALLADRAMAWFGHDSTVASSLGPDGFSSIYVVTPGQ